MKVSSVRYSDGRALLTVWEVCFLPINAHFLCARRLGVLTVSDVLLGRIHIGCLCTSIPTPSSSLHDASLLRRFSTRRTICLYRREASFMRLTERLSDIASIIRDERRLFPFSLQMGERLMSPRRAFLRSPALNQRACMHWLQSGIVEYSSLR